jgi:ubiquinone/menaquinone biosynthesis C-methylase UbiE
MKKKSKKKLFDEWSAKYDRWFTTPIGRLVKKYEAELILDLLKPSHGDSILDAGCGTGVFTADLISLGSRVIGLDVSLPMLARARQKSRGYPFQAVLGDILSLPFPDGSFDKVVTVTALEFIQDGMRAVEELFRVTRSGGCVVAATLNSLSPWASRRKAEAKKDHTLFSRAIFRSPDELLSLASAEGFMRTAIHFQDDDDPEKAVQIELEGRRRGLDTGAFVAARWMKDY